ncbi:hypothetical protein [Chitinimonas sp. BJYL2]|uniref:hypothetical protein n=1 Tax=Chitinimonas sp. BJYL2 TaxID=2976696 RepID=UPI0022B34757|nr:hypothetical protein [Chitinimonas sp. BJYL2]
MNWNETAKAFLDAYRHGRDVPGGLLFAKALQQAKLDFTPHSLDRIDALLDQIHQKIRPSKEGFIDDVTKRNFALMLAFYLGEYVAKASGSLIEWRDYDETVAAMPPDAGLPREFFSYITCTVGGQLILPLGYIMERLFNGDTKFVAREYVEGRLDVIQADQRRDLNVWSKEMLDAFARDGYVSGGLAYRLLLRQAKLDYSMESLDRIDALLLKIRGEQSPEYVAFVNKTTEQNFLSFLAFYLAATVARLGSFPLKWYSFDQAGKVLKNLQFSFETTQICAIGKQFYTPLGTLTEILFSPEADISCRRQAEAILRENPDRLVSIPTPERNQGPRGALDLPANWAIAVEQTGFLAATSIFMVQGGQLTPTSLEPGADGNATLISHMFEHPGEAIERCAQQMASNPKSLPHQAFVYDAYSYLPTGRTDALILEMVAYKPKPFRISVALPYRQASANEDFALQDPILLDCSMAKDFHPEIFAQFYKGIYSFKSQDFSWDECLIRPVNPVH